MNVGSLFSGIGGIELGFEAEGFHTEWFVECEPYAQTILRKRFPNAVIYDDVTKIDWRTVPKVDVLTGGFPCQDISNAGKRAGITGSRSSLWKHYLEAIRILRPKYCLIENVSALTRRGLDVVLADLASVGCDAEWHCVPASAIGAPHRRDRIIIISYPNSSGHVHGESQEQSSQGGEQTQRDSESRCDDVAHANCIGSSCTCNAQNGRTEDRFNVWEKSNVEHACCERLEGQCKSFRENEKFPKQCFNGWWATEPGLD